jgi:hypothetical protein
MKAIVSSITMMVLCFAIAVGSTHATVVDHGLFAGLLDRHQKNGSVDYRGFQQEEAILDRYLDMLAAIDPAALSGDEQFAFYVNAYNAWTIKLILSQYPEIQSIKELGNLFKSPWKKKIARINGQLLSLDQIEHDILRKEFKDPRVHFAVNCASKGCPPLQDEPFTGSRLDSQLNQAAADFINTPRFNRLEGDTLHISKIFDWFSEDFDDEIIDYIIKFADAPLRDQLEANRGGIRVKYLDYDWSLNGT